MQRTHYFRALNRTTVGLESRAVPVRDAVVPIAGLGTRMLPATRAVPKALLPLVDRPVVEVVLDELAGAGLTRFVLVAGRDIEAVARHFADDDRVEVVLQPEPRGLGDAVMRGGEATGGRPFVVALGDALVDGGLVARLVDAFERSSAAAAVGVEEVAPDAVSRYGIVGPAGDGDPLLLRGLVEKPDPGSAPSRLAIAARYVLAPEAVDVLRATAPGRGGEVQLTDALARMCSDGRAVVAVRLAEGERRIDVGEPEGYAAAFVERALADPRFGERLRRTVGRARG